MEYHVGDTVCVLPYEQIKATFVDGRHAEDGLYFNPAMEKYCGRTLVISRRLTSTRYCLRGAEDWLFCPDWFEEYTPPNDVTITISFEDMMDAMHD